MIIIITEEEIKEPERKPESAGEKRQKKEKRKKETKARRLLASMQKKGGNGQFKSDLKIRWCSTPKAAFHGVDDNGVESWCSFRCRQGVVRQVGVTVRPNTQSQTTG